MLFKSRVFLLVFCLAVMLLFSCASKKAMWGNEKDGFILSYRLSPDQSWSYQSTGEEITNLVIMGNEQETKASSRNDYTVTANESKETNLSLTVTIDEFVRDTNSPQGEWSVDSSPIIGKNFTLILSPLGKELEFDGIDELKIDMGDQDGGEQSVLNYYRNPFPNLAEKPLKIGESWTEADSFTAPAGNMQVTVNTETKHSLTGMETIDGLECLKVSSTVTGILTGIGEQDGNDLMLDGKLDGSGTWYFAYKKGMLLKADSASDLNGDIDVSGGGFDLKIPITQKTNSIVKLVQE